MYVRSIKRGIYSGALSRRCCKKFYKRYYLVSLKVFYKKLLKTPKVKKKEGTPITRLRRPKKKRVYTNQTKMKVLSKMVDMKIYVGMN